MTINPINGALTAGIASQWSEDINPQAATLFSGDEPDPVAMELAMAANTVFAANAVVGFDGNGNTIMATYGAVVGVKATGVLTFTAAGSATETVLIGGRTYTLVAALTGAADEVLIGANATATALALKDAINANAATLNVTHGSVAENASVSATSALGVVTVTAREAGVAENSVTTTETSAVASWASATLTGGKDAAFTGVKAIGIAVYAADSTGKADGAMKNACWRQGMFNPDVLVWDASFDTDEKKRLAFEGAPSPTSIFIRKPMQATV
jgi:hypothetical protein